MTDDADPRAPVESSPAELGVLGRARRWRAQRSPQQKERSVAGLDLPDPDPSFAVPWNRPSTTGAATDTAAAPRPRPRPRPGPGVAARVAAPAGASAPRPRPLPRPRPGPGVPSSTTAVGTPSPGPTGGHGWTRTLLRLAVIIVIAAIATFVLRTFVVEPYYIPSESMEPTLHGCAACVDDRVLVDKISYRFHDPRQGDVIVFDRPPNAGITEPQLIKRVIGVPGDKIVLRGGKVLVNGTVLREKYLSARLLAQCGGTQPLTNQVSWTVPSGDLFVMGDNRCHSNDSRYFGPIKQSSVIGRAFLRFWPLGRFGGIH